MDNIDRQQLLNQPVLQQVLATYSELIVQAGENRTEEDQGTRWATRICELSNVDTADLSQIHGQLIAFGWLTFQIEDKASGLMYRITSSGKKAFDWAKKNEPETVGSEAA